MKNKYAYSVAVVLLILAPMLYFGENRGNSGELPAANGAQICVKYIDVGQGDSEFIKLPDGETILIDAGEKKSAENVISLLNDMSVKKIDYLVATHPHADHIGGMADVIDSFDIGRIYMPRADYDSKTYLTMLEKTDDKGLKINTVTAGVEIPLSCEVKAEFLAPCSSSYESTNDYSAVLKLTYGKTKFLFCGDAEKLSENEMLSKKYDLSADVLKVAHHGSKTSSSEAFLDKVNPKYAIISCGINNKYSHPSDETMDKLSKRNIEVFRTDKMGTITIYSDGENIKTEVEK